jgi:hypothetical protein
MANTNTENNAANNNAENNNAANPPGASFDDARSNALDYTADHGQHAE